MKTETLHAKSVSELKEELLALLKEQFNLRMQKVTGQLNQFNAMKRVRRNIARVKTILKEREGKA